ncbi:MAG: LacI family DNA-binding transcriptional regulator [Verrucomicrobiota bacterium]
MLDLARAAGVSKNTVSLALRRDPQIPARTREKIEALARAMGYIKNPTVAHLMVQLRAGAATGHRAALALLNAHEDRDAFRTHPTIPTYVEGCRRQAAQAGYSLDPFWLHDPDLDGAKLVKILRARGIQGVLLVGLMDANRLPERFQAVWEAFPCVVTGVRTRDPALSFACTDHHMLALRAVEAALRLGYRRPGLVLDGVIDRLVEHRFTSGFLIAQRSLPPARRVRPFYAVREARQDVAPFRQWWEKERPDVILTLYHAVRGWLADWGVHAPRDVGLIQLEWRRAHADWAGMDQHNDVVGEAAVEMVIGMIHRAESGVPLFPRATLLGSTWVEGSTVRACPPSPSGKSFRNLGLPDARSPSILGVA